MDIKTMTGSPCASSVTLAISKAFSRLRASLILAQDVAHEAFVVKPKGLASSYSAVHLGWAESGGIPLFLRKCSP